LLAIQFKFCIICCTQARKARRALKGLVKIQALVRGFLVRKRVAATLHSMQALMRAQAVVRSRRARNSIDKENIYQLEIRGRKHVVIKTTSFLYANSIGFHQNFSLYLLVFFFSLVANVR